MKNIYLILFSLFLGYNISAQCPAGQTEITIEINAAAFPTEIGWELVDQTANVVIACQPQGTYLVAGTVTEGPFCVTDGNALVFTGYDSFGDDWNGGSFNVIITEDGSVNGCGNQDGCIVIQDGGLDVDTEPDVSVTNSCETSNEEFIVMLPAFACNNTPFMGCTTMADPNFEPCATIDDGSCICSDTQTGVVTGDTFCATDAAATASVIIPDSPLTAVQTVDGNFDNEHGLGLYLGTFDDGSVIGLPPAGTGLFGTDTEASIEASTPGANNITTVGNFGNPSAVGNSFTSVPLMDGATYTVFIVDDFGDGWDGSDADLVDCEGNVIVPNLAQYIDAIAGNAQNELASFTFVYNAPPPTVVWSGAGAVTTDPDATPNTGDEVYTFDPSMAGAAGCDPTDVDLTMSVTSCGNTCDQIVTVTVFPPAQTPAVTQADEVCNYTITLACPNDAVDPATFGPVAPGDDPPPTDFTVTTENGCTDTFSIDPAPCATLPPPEAALNCPAEIDLCAGGTVSIGAADNNAESAPTSTPTYGGTAAAFINTMGTSVVSDDVIDVSLIPAAGTYNLTLQLTAANGDMSNVAECTISVVINCDADGGNFPTGP